MDQAGATRFPNIDLPNNVGARGFAPGGTFHTYLVPLIAPPALTGLGGLAAIGTALIANPTPGRDKPASPRGTVNDVGGLVPLVDLSYNLVRSFLIKTNNVRRTDVVVNYTLHGQHTMNEGFVLRFAELKGSGRIELITYGEGDTWKMRPGIRSYWEPKIIEAWTKAANEIFAAALRRSA